MNPGNCSFDPLANYSDQSYEQIRRSNVPPYEEQQGNNFHSAGATYKSGVIFQSPLHQTNNEVVDVAAQDPVVIGLHKEPANFYRGKKAKRCFRDWPFVYFSNGFISHLFGDNANINMWTSDYMKARNSI